MAVHSKQLFAGAVNCSSPVRIYTCPTAKHTIVKTLRVLPVGGVATSYIAYLDRGSGAVAYLGTGPCSSGTLFSLVGLWDVVHPGEHVGIVIYGSTGNSLIWLSGTELDV